MELIKDLIPIAEELLAKLKETTGSDWYVVRASVQSVESSTFKVQSIYHNGTSPDENLKLTIVADSIQKFNYFVESAYKLKDNTTEVTTEINNATEKLIAAYQVFQDYIDDNIEYYYINTVPIEATDDLIQVKDTLGPFLAIKGSDLSKGEIIRYATNKYQYLKYGIKNQKLEVVSVTKKTKSLADLNFSQSGTSVIQ